MIVLSGMKWMRQTSNESIWPVVDALPRQVEECCGGEEWRRECVRWGPVEVLKLFGMSSREELRCIPWDLSECHTVVGS